MSVSMRKPIIWFTLLCFVATQTVALERRTRTRKVWRQARPPMRSHAAAS